MAPSPGVPESASEIELPGVPESASLVELPGVVAVARATAFPGVAPTEAAPTPVKTAMATAATMSSVANDLRNTMILSGRGPLREKVRRRRGPSRQ